MPRFAHVRSINVSMWGRRVGTIIPAPRNGYYAFLYDKGFVRSGVQISPISISASAALREIKHPRKSRQPPC